MTSLRTSAYDEATFDQAFRSYLESCSRNLSFQFYVTCYACVFARMRLCTAALQTLPLWNSRGQSGFALTVMSEIWGGEHGASRRAVKVDSISAIGK